MQQLATCKGNRGQCRKPVCIGERGKSVSLCEDHYKGRQTSEKKRSGDSGRGSKPVKRKRNGNDVNSDDALPNEPERLRLEGLAEEDKMTTLLANVPDKHQVQAKRALLNGGLPALQAFVQSQTESELDAVIQTLRDLEFNTVIERGRITTADHHAHVRQVDLSNVIQHKGEAESLLLSKHGQEGGESKSKRLMPALRVYMQKQWVNHGKLPLLKPTYVEMEKKRQFAAAAAAAAEHEPEWDDRDCLPSTWFRVPKKTEKTAEAVTCRYHDKGDDECKCGRCPFGPHMVPFNLEPVDASVTGQPFAWDPFVDLTAVLTPKWTPQAERAFTEKYGNKPDESQIEEKDKPFYRVYLWKQLHRMREQTDRIIREKATSVIAPRQRRVAEIQADLDRLKRRQDALEPGCEEEMEIRFQRQPLEQELSDALNRQNGIFASQSRWQLLSRSGKLLSETQVRETQLAEIRAYLAEQKRRPYDYAADIDKKDKEERAKVRREVRKLEGRMQHALSLDYGTVEGSQMFDSIYREFKKRQMSGDM